MLCTGPSSERTYFTRRVTNPIQVHKDNYRKAMQDELGHNGTAPTEIP